MSLPVKSLSAPFFATLAALVWLAAISSLHLYLNTEAVNPSKITMGYMPVITNLAAPLVDEASKGKAVRFEARKFSSFAEMAEAFRSNHIQVAFIIAPLAITLHEQGVPLKVIYIGNRHESTMVVRKDLAGSSLAQMTGKTIAVPIRFSGHLLAIKRYLREQGLPPDAIRTVEVPPPDMPAALNTGGIDGYFVGEPFAGKSLENGSAARLLNVESIWPRFICNVMIVRDDLIAAHPEWVQTLVQGAVRSGYWAKDHIEEAIKVASGYWGQDPKVIRYAFSTPPDRVRFDLFLPKFEEFQEIAGEMREAGLLDGPAKLQGLIDDRFAMGADITPVGSLRDIIQP